MIKRSMAALLLAATCAAPAALAQDVYPSRIIRMIVPYAAGGPTDVLARIVAQKLGESLGQTVIVENKPGGSGIPGTDAIAKARPDGYTIGLSTIGPLAVNPSLFANIPYDPLKDFAPLMLLARSYSLLALHPGVPAQNMRELVALLKANPDKYSYASGGVGTTQHLSGELFSHVAGVKMLHVPYKGEGAAQTDLLGGQVSMMFTSTIVGYNNVKAGKLRAMGVTAAQRLPAMPEIPTIAESGYTGFEVTAWFGMVAPAGTPEPIVRRLNKELEATLKHPDVAKKFEELGAMPAGGPPSDLTALLRSELPLWRDVIRKGNIKLE